MLILAGASLNVLVGQNGILRKAQDAVVAYKDAEENEKLQLQVAFLDYSYLAKMESLIAMGRELQETENYSVAQLDEKTILAADYKNHALLEISIDGKIVNSNHFNCWPDEYFEFDEITGAIKGFTELARSDGTYYSDEGWNPKLENIAIPEKINGINVTSVDLNLDNMDAIANLVILPPSVKNIMSLNVRGKKSNTALVLIGQNLEMLSGSGNDSYVTGIILPNGFKKLGDYAFSRTDMEYLDLPDTTSVIGDSALAGSKIHYVRCLGVQEIGVRAFYGCKALSEIVSGNNVQLTIKDQAFYNTCSLKRFEATGIITRTWRTCFSEQWT